MHIGLYNSCLLEWNVDRLLSWAAYHGYVGVELHAGPRFRHDDWDAVANGRSNPVIDAQTKYPVRVCGLMYGPLNFLSPDQGERDAAFARLETLLRAARRSGVPLVSTFTGRDAGLTLEQNVDRYADRLRRIAELAEQYEVDVAF